MGWPKGARVQWGDICAWTTRHPVRLAQSFSNGFRQVCAMAKYALRLGDSDDQKVWGGRSRSGDAPATYVSDLQRQLQGLGFRLARTSGPVADSPGVFGFWTAMAVREFQAYAALPTAAVDASQAGNPFSYVIQAKAAADVYPASQPISGVVNTTTAQLLQTWIQNKWRCPVIICGFSKLPTIQAGVFADPTFAKSLMVVNNAWSAFDHLSAATVYCSLDYTDVSGKMAAEAIGRGHALLKKKRDSHIGGLVADARYSPASAAITPVTLIGKPVGQLSPEEAATYRVIHAVADCEVSARFDSVNGWDAQVLSFGPFQFTATAADKSGRPQTGELPAYFAMLEAGSAAEQQAFFETLGALGISSDPDWAAITPVASQRTLLAHMAFQGPNDGTMADEAEFNIWPAVKEAKAPVREWHLFRRFVLAGRRSKTLQLAFWRFCRLRLRNLLATPWGTMDGYQWPAKVTLGDVFRSELAAAVLVRLHVKAPGLFATADAGKVVNTRDWLKYVIRNFDYADKTKPPAQWKLSDETPLLQALVDRLRQGDVEAGQGMAKITVPSVARTVLAECQAMIDGETETPLGALAAKRSFTPYTKGL